MVLGEKDVGGVVPGLVLRGLRVRGLPIGGGRDQPALREDRLLRPLRPLADRFLGPPRGRGPSYGEDSMWVSSRNGSNKGLQGNISRFNSIIPF